jgi:hypothetical protein
MRRGKCGETLAFKMTFAEFGGQGAISGRGASHESDPCVVGEYTSHSCYHLTKVGAVEIGKMREKQAEKVIYRTFENVAQSFGRQ